MTPNYLLLARNGKSPPGDGNRGLDEENVDENKDPRSAHGVNSRHQVDQSHGILFDEAVWADTCGEVHFLGKSDGAVTGVFSRRLNFRRATALQTFTITDGDFRCARSAE